MRGEDSNKIEQKNIIAKILEDLDTPIDKEEVERVMKGASVRVVR